jgi:aspartate 1-decarboxylase
MKTFVSAKIHGIRVTDKSLKYHGSVSICPRLMQAAGIEEYEQVHLVNLSTGDRWVTYAIKAEEGAFTLNGGGARLGEVGDECVILAYSTCEQFEPANVVFCDPSNRISELHRYGAKATVDFPYQRVP